MDGKLWENWYGRTDGQKEIWLKVVRGQDGAEKSGVAGLTFKA